MNFNDGRTLVLRSVEEKDAVTMLDYIKQTAEERLFCGGNGMCSPCSML
ncbi:hypothetical protein [Butyrivibrio fibrisolvens]|nr:hypothetical protein [Butyrivibrio fibrisolvens]